MLATVIRRHWHALVREVLALGRRASDMFTERLTFAEMLSIVLGAPPTSSLGSSLNQGWSPEAHLLANLQEQQGGIAGRMTDPIPRPGIDQRPEHTSDDRFFRGDPYTWTEFDELERKRESDARTALPGTTRVRTI